MEACEITELTEDFSGIERTERERPSVGPDEVLIRIRACSLNFRDLAIAHSEREYRDRALPVIPLSDGAGEIAEVGTAVDRFAVGDRVVTPFSPSWRDGPITVEKLGDSLGAGEDGTLAEFATYKAESVPRLPEHLSYEEGATLPCAGLTAWNALVERGDVTAGETVLLLGTGGVATFGLQFADMHGADPFVISSSDEKLERARSLGANWTLNYEDEPEWGEVVPERTGGGVDHVIEVGGAGTIQRSVEAARLGGSVHMIGVLTEPDEPFNPMSILGNGLDVGGIFAVGSTAMAERMNRAIAANEMEPVIDRTFGFDEVRDAYRYLDSGQHHGKVVITVD